jgi:predicted polyphosphate/ATP-dependent NAD kinase
MGDGVEPLVGIIANPASGKDIRRLVAHGSTFDNNEKINIVRRVLVGLAATGVGRVAFLPDGYAIVGRAAEPLDLGMEVVPLAMESRGEAGDSLEAARRLAGMGVRVIVTLGGDGTNRVVAKGCGEVPLVPISTGTNNVFPRMIEGTLAGLAAGLVATGQVGNRAGAAAVVRRRPRLDLAVDGEAREMALVDVVTSRQVWVGARALWEPSQVAEVVLSGIVPAAIGFASLGHLLFPGEGGSGVGAHVTIGAGSGRSVLAPVAPGLLRRVPIGEAALVRVGETVRLGGDGGTIALDGEREVTIPPRGAVVEVTLRADGPWVVEVEAALRQGAELGVFGGAG